MIVRQSRLSSARQALRSTRSAFTLMEVLVVVAIIVILAGVATVSFFGVWEKSKEDAAKASIRGIEDALDIYRLANGNSYPPNLDALTQRQKGNKPALLKDEALNDPWGNKFNYEPGNRHPKTDKPHIFTNGDPGAPQMIDNWK